MKPGDWIKLLAIALIAGGAAFLVSQRVTSDDPPADEVAWLIQEFALTEPQAEQVRNLHEAYRPICEAHCEAVMQAQRALDQASDPTATENARRELARLKEVCHEATQAHLEAVAAVMPADQGQRFIETISPLLSAHEHTAPFGLR